MDHNKSELDIQFYDNHDVSIDIKTPDEYKLYFEVALLSLFTIRQFSNLGGMPQLASALKSVRNVELKEFDIGDYINASDVQISVPRIVSSRWGKKKSFKAEMFFIETQEKPICAMKLDTNGFGLFGSEVKYYAIQSINALTRYFALKYRNNKDISILFKYAVFLLGNICDNRSVIAAGNIVGQGQAVNQILIDVFGADEE